MLHLYTLTGLGTILSSSGKTGTCKALFWLGWTHGSGSQHPTHKMQGHWHLLKFSCTHFTLTPETAGENSSSGHQSAAHIQWLFSENSSSDCQVNEQIQQRQLLLSPTIRLTRSPLKGWFLWSTFLTAMFSPWMVLCGREKSAFVHSVSFYCYRRDNIATIISKVQSHKRANSRLKYINKW